MVQATRGVTIRDFFIFQLKLVLDGFKSLVVFWCSIVAVVIDFLSGRGRRPRLFYSVLRASERFDLWLNMNGAVVRLDPLRPQRVPPHPNDDGLFGASRAGSHTMLGELERIVRGGDQRRGRK
jgi:hypothetical protein